MLHRTILRATVLASVLSLAATTGSSLGASAASNGSLDTTWSGDGKVDVPAESPAVLRPLASGRLYVAAHRNQDGGQMRVRRYEPDGTPSSAFGTSGTILRSFEATGTSADSYPTHVLSTTSSLIVVGESETGTSSRLGVMKLSTTGAYNTGFSADGKVTYRVTPNVHAHVEPFGAAVLSDGRIIVAVRAYGDPGGGSTLPEERAIIRLTATGGLDTSFSGDGIMPLTLADNAITVLSDARLYVSRTMGETEEVRMLLPAGAMDAAFSGDGRAQVACGSHVETHLWVRSGGGVAVACTRSSAPKVDYTVLTKKGLPDAAFSADGKTSLIMWTVNMAAGLPALSVGDDGSLWATAVQTSPTKALVTYKLSSTGVPASTWGTAGAATTPYSTVLTVGQVASRGGRTYLSVQKDVSNNAILALVAL